MATVAVTGADGFIGAHLCAVLEHDGHRVIRIVRRRSGAGEDRRVVADLASASDLGSVLEGAEVVIHLAGRAHVLRDTEPDPDSAFRRANVDSTVRLAEAAARAKVRRVVFVSSIGVNGDQTHGAAFVESATPAPVESYARSKLEAEQQLLSVAKREHIETVIVRPAIVYGPGAPGNVRRLLSLVSRGLPLPLAAIQNKRNLIGVENLSDLLLLCAGSPAAAGELFLAAEPDAHSTPELLRVIARGMGRPSRLFSVPEQVLRLSAQLVGMRAQFEKLCGSLEVNADKARGVLGWKPRVSFEDGIVRTAQWYRNVG